MENTEIKQMFQEIMGELSNIKEEVSLVQEKLEEMSTKQLTSILTQIERFTKELMQSNSYAEMMINAQALTDTVQLDKDDLKQLISDAFPQDSQSADKMMKEFDRLKKKLIEVNDNLVDGIDAGESNNHNRALAILERLDTMKHKLSSAEDRIRGVEQTVRTIPGRSLY